jgi:hypothetical protein
MDADLLPPERKRVLYNAIVCHVLRCNSFLLSAGVEPGRLPRRFF